MRRQVSLLLANGHRDAQEYPVGLVFEESQLAVDRINGMLATEATILHAVMATAVSAFGKKGSAQKANAALSKLIKDLGGDG